MATCLEPLFGYLSLSMKLFKSSKYCGWNFGPKQKNNLTVIEVASLEKNFCFLNQKSKLRKAGYMSQQIYL